MDFEHKQQLILDSLEHAAEVLGDITAPVYARYYARCPEARAHFTRFHPDSPERLEGTMVEQALYCLMHWFDAPGEVEIVLTGTIPHHIETLGVPAELFSLLITAVCDIVIATVPAGAEDERGVWRELHDGLLRLCRNSAQQAVPAGRGLAAGGT